MAALVTLPETRRRDRQWYVVRTKPRKEDYAVDQLDRRGVPVFFPRILEYGRDQVAPLFPGYLFVHIGLFEHYYRVVWTPGVRSFVAFGATPTSVQESVILFIAASAGEGGIIRPLAPFKVSDRARSAGASRFSSISSGRAPPLNCPSVSWIASSATSPGGVAQCPVAGRAGRSYRQKGPG